MQEILVTRLTDKEVAEKKIKSWPVWTKEISTFDWFYDSEEHCYILEGEIAISTAKGNVSLSPGDYVIFKKGLACTWKISKNVRKHYKFL
jgi:uncharacterized cupin superfamily protein